KSGIEANDFWPEATYCLSATARIKTDVAIHKVAQISAGMPVALAIFKASVGTVAAKGDERKKTVFRSSSAFRTNWTTNKLTKKGGTGAEGNRATRNRPADNSTPANRVKGRPLKDNQAPANNGLITPKIIVNDITSTAEPKSTMRAATARRIKTRSSAP